MWFGVVCALAWAVADVALFVVRDRRGHVVESACLRQIDARRNTIHFVGIHHDVRHARNCTRHTSSLDGFATREHIDQHGHNCP